MKINKSLISTLTVACVTGSALSLIASAADFPATTTVAQERPTIDIAGYTLPIDFASFMYVLFLADTNDTAEPADINDLPIVSNEDDDPNGFYQIFMLP